MIKGYWFPRSIREWLVTPEVEFESQSFANGRPCGLEDPGAINVHWPILKLAQWERLLSALQQNRQCAPKGREFWERLQDALKKASLRFRDTQDELQKLAISAIPGYTGFSEPMIRFTLGALDLMSLEQFPAAFGISPTFEMVNTWRPIPGLPGRLRFFGKANWQNAWRQKIGNTGRPIFSPLVMPDLVIGFGAGNVPGTSLLISFLALATSLNGEVPPAIVVRNSRHEPIFTPLILTALEAVDADLVSSLAVLVWDYEDKEVQPFLLSRANLVIAAASDETIDQIETQLQQVQQKPTKADLTHPTRLHAHGHKFSFSAISREVLKHDLADPISGRPFIEIISLLAGLDSVFWDQYGCLSARIHFVETGNEDCHTPEGYAICLEEQLRLLATHLPRGAWPRQQIYDSFDRYKQLEVTGKVKVLSRYEDEFLVAIDERPLDAAAFQMTVNSCLGRVVIVRPVVDLMEIPDHYLRFLPVKNLQTLSVAIGQEGEDLPERFLHFAELCGRRGVTAIRSVGRGAFPQLAYSWDGLIPLDLVRERPVGHFTTIEFDHPLKQIMETFQLLLKLGI